MLSTEVIGTTSFPLKTWEKISLLIGMFFSGTRIVRTHLFGVELAGLVIRFYFGITGCIIPVGGFLDWHKDVTLGAPCDSDGRKEFYMFCYSPAPCETRLRFKSHLWIARFRN
jgi:hypothetical protein